MLAIRGAVLTGLAVALTLVLHTSCEGQPKTKGVWTDPNDATLPADFKIQGEYVGEIKGGGKLGAQVIALGNGAFQAVILPGGLPGEGWDGKNKILLDGKLEGQKAEFKPASGKKQYLAQAPGSVLRHLEVSAGRPEGLHRHHQQ